MSPTKRFWLIETHRRQYREAILRGDTAVAHANHQQVQAHLAGAQHRAALRAASRKRQAQAA
jgi:hypothetical protein